jgi:hypothetical protein
MALRLAGWPLILGSLGLVFGLMVGSAAASMFEIMLLSGPKGPTVGALLGALGGVSLGW